MPCILEVLDRNLNLRVLVGRLLRDRFCRRGHTIRVRGSTLLTVIVQPADYYVINDVFLALFKAPCPVHRRGSLVEHVLTITNGTNKKVQPYLDKRPHGVSVGHFHDRVPP